jgi:hypothetical protein
MWTLARQPLWKKKEALKNEADLTIYIAKLRAVDLSDEPWQWAVKGRAAVDKVFKAVAAFCKVRKCPDSFKTSFSGVRADLHQGYLSIDVVFLGPASFGAAAYLRERLDGFEDVTVVTTDSVDDAINTFGNLMSSMAIYNDTTECQALMESFRGRRLVQPRGRFVGLHTMGAGEADEDATGPSGGEGALEDSTKKDQGIYVEVNSASQSPDTSPVDFPLTAVLTEGEGTEAPDFSQRCHQCGGETRPAGRRAGNWKQKTGAFSGQRYWELMPDTA